jgi:hypothetical protein
MVPWETGDETGGRIYDLVDSRDGATIHPAALVVIPAERSDSRELVQDSREV